MSVSIKGVKTEGAPASGLSVKWNDGQLVVIICPVGLVACAAIDVEVMEEFNFAVAVAHGTPQKPLVEPEDLLEAKISNVTKKASLMGITAGMSGKEALEIMTSKGDMS